MSVDGQLQKWIAEILDPRMQFVGQFLEGTNWIAVPVESGSHFDDSDIQRIALAAQSSGIKTLHAFLVEEATGIVPHLQFEATTDGLQYFNRLCAHFNYAICPEDRSFLILCSTRDYYLVAGPQKFVTSALGTSILEARTAFAEFAADSFWPEPERSFLRELSSRYKK